MDITTEELISGPSQLSNQEVISDFKVGFQSRLLSKQIRSDVLTGKAKFGIESAGKELCQIALAKTFRKGDYFSGYYRDQSFMMAKGLANPSDVLASLYADSQNDPFTAGRNMNAHYATSFIDENDNWLDLVNKYNVGAALSPLAGHVPRALGMALASKYYKNLHISNQFSNRGEEVSFSIIGDATAAEGVFFESVNAACVMQVPIVFVIQDDGYGISVPTKLQTAKGSVSEALAGMQRSQKGSTGCEIYTVNGWDYIDLINTFKEAGNQCRVESVPVIIHIEELTQLNGHSTSGSHERYKPKERLAWEKEMDCLVHFENFIIKNKYLTLDEIENLKIEWAGELRSFSKSAWANFQAPFLGAKKDLVAIINKMESSNDAHIKKGKRKLANLNHGVISNLLEIAEEVILSSLKYPNTTLLSKLKSWRFTQKKDISAKYNTHLYSESNKAAINIAPQQATYNEGAPMVNGYQILNAYFDYILGSDINVCAFGEDLGKIGGVNKCFSGLQEKYGEERVFDTGIREWTIIGQGIGMAMRGLRPISEIQYLDYLIYALPAISDELATLRWRTAGKQKAPVIIRTRGHRLEGIWHSGSPMGMLLGSLRGVYLLTPRSMTQAAGMYNTLMKGDDPAVVVECLNGYRKKEKMPNNLDSLCVPLGMPEKITHGEDITLVTYGACVHIAQQAVNYLQDIDIYIELIDVQTLLPFDLEHTIVHSIKKTNSVIFLDEDVPGGGTAYMMREVLENQNAYIHLDSKPVCITATAHRTPYGDDGNYASKPMVADIVKKVLEIMNETDPELYNLSI
ncbi:MAG: thiamine pyrophosphate-dependent enzyme [Saprospiraceae bacterium]